MWNVMSADIKLSLYRLNKNNVQNSTFAALSIFSCFATTIYVR